MDNKILDLNFAASCLQLGGVIMYPTETFMALGCVISNPQSIERVFAIKRRSKDQPLPLIIGDVEQLEFLTPELSPPMQKLLLKLELFFWPGPLTVLFPAHHRVHPLVCGGGSEVAVRVTSHPQAKELALRVGPLVASSANFSGQPPVTDPAALTEEFFHLVAGWLPPKPKPTGGAPSTIVRPSADGKSFEVLREGAVPRQRLSAAGFEVV